MKTTSKNTKSHIPSTSATGLRGAAICGKFTDFRTGDHDLIRRLAKEAVATGTAGHYCKKCLKGL